MFLVPETEKVSVGSRLCIVGGLQRDEQTQLLTDTAQCRYDAQIFCVDGSLRMVGVQRRKVPLE